MSTSLWGVSTAAAMLNSYARQYTHLVNDGAVRELLSSGDAYASATKVFISQLPELVRQQVITVFF